MAARGVVGEDVVGIHFPPRNAHPKFHNIRWQVFYAPWRARCVYDFELPMTLAPLGETPQSSAIRKNVDFPRVPLASLITSFLNSRALSVTQGALPEHEVPVQKHRRT